MKRFREARDRGCAYLLRLLREDGSFGDLEQGVAEYYKVPTAFQVCGQTEAANRLCGWIRNNGMTPEGDFGPRPRAAEGYSYTYYNTWVIIGTHRLGQFDLSQKGMDFLLNFWDSESGGFYSSPSEREARTLQDLWVVSGCGHAALYTGRIHVARGVGHWMQRMMDAQPNYPEEMYTVYSRATGLHTETDPDDPIRYVLVNAAEGDQFFSTPGSQGHSLHVSTRQPMSTSGSTCPGSICVSPKRLRTICTACAVQERLGGLPQSCTHSPESKNTGIWRSKLATT